MKELKRISLVLLVGLLTTVSSQGRDDNQWQWRDRHPGLKKLVVASPRASLAAVPQPPSTDAANTDCQVIGATYNFARNGASVRLPLGAGLRVKLADTLEGVWYDDTHGWLGTLLILDVARPDSDPNAIEWVTIGRDGRSAERSGPSIGWGANIGVNFRPPRVGDYLLRARIFTFALPTPAPDVVDAPQRPADVEPCGDASYDEVRIRLTVIECPGTLDEASGMLSDDAPTEGTNMETDLLEIIK